MGLDLGGHLGQEGSQGGLWTSGCGRARSMGRQLEEEAPLAGMHRGVDSSRPATDLVGLSGAPVRAGMRSTAHQPSRELFRILFCLILSFRHWRL